MLLGRVIIAPRKLVLNRLKRSNVRISDDDFGRSGNHRIGDIDNLYAKRDLISVSRGIGRFQDNLIQSDNHAIARVLVEYHLDVGGDVAVNGVVRRKRRQNIGHQERIVDIAVQFRHADEDRTDRIENRPFGIHFIICEERALFELKLTRIAICEEIAAGSKQQMQIIDRRWRFERDVTVVGIGRIDEIRIDVGGLGIRRPVDQKVDQDLAPGFLVHHFHG